jgi:glucan phosphoethanolaminetransferase (alkaline phosphatase superfamily)
MGFNQRFRSFVNQKWQQIKNRFGFWKQLFTSTVLSCFFYVFMEWLFFVTMPSFMSLMSSLEKVEIFLLSGFGMALFALVVVAAFIVLDVVAVITGLSRIIPLIGTAFSALILSSLALLLIDNFTYTVFKFGISTSSGFWRGAYALLFVLLFGIIWYRTLKAIGLTGQATPETYTINRQFYFSVIILIVSMGLALTRLDFNTMLKSSQIAETKSAIKQPNIILLGSDGLNAENLSVYGYARNTTPQLKILAQTSLVAENAFTNAGNSAGSVISLFTSKLPTQTRVLYPPDILTGINSFQHLPGILNNQGYTSIEYGVPYYIDAYSYNLQDGFDIANNRTLSEGKLGDLGRKLGFDSEVYLLSRLTWRLSDRILHIFFIRTMENPFDIVTHPVRNLSDKDKIKQLLAQVDQVDAPVFIHAHLLGTHGGLYSPPNPYYSLGESQTRPWMVDFYDDTLRAFDSYVGQVIQHLKESGEYENTILIIYTDHNKEFKVNERIPLIIHFPGDEYGGKITQNVQNLDIAPTILDYLGLPRADWMGGKSLLSGNPSTDRLIFSMGTTEVKQNEADINFLDPESKKPPFYQFSYVNIIDCQKWYSIDLNTYRWTSGDVKGYVGPCKADSLRSFDEIKQALANRLATDGFDITSLP